MQWKSFTGFLKLLFLNINVLIFLESMDSNIPRVKNRRHDISNLNKLLYTVYAGWSRATCLLEHGALRRGVWVCVCWTISASVDMVVLSFNHFRRHYRVNKVERRVRCCWHFSRTVVQSSPRSEYFVPLSIFRLIRLRLF